MEPRITPIKNGYAALGDGWAVFGRDPEDARARFVEAERQHAAIRSRGVPNELQPQRELSPTDARV